MACQGLSLTWVNMVGGGGTVPLWLLFFSCTLMTTRTGLLHSNNGNLRVTTSEGKSYSLSLGEDAALLSQLQGCGISVEGNAIGRHLIVKKWRVTDAGDGSAPFLGRLFLRGRRIYVDDVNSGQIIELLPTEHFNNSMIEEVVLVVGIVVGPQQVMVHQIKTIKAE